MRETMRALTQTILSPVGALLAPVFPVKLPELSAADMLAVRLSVGELETVQHEPYAGITRRIERHTGIAKQEFAETMAEVLHENLGAI